MEFTTVTSILQEKGIDLNSKIKQPDMEGIKYKIEQNNPKYNKNK